MTNLKVIDWGPKKKRVRDKDDRLIGEVFLLGRQRFWVHDHAGRPVGEAADIADAHIDDYVALNWLEWNGGGLRLTTTGENVCKQLTGGLV